MDMNTLPERLREEAQIHISDGYEIASYEDGLLTMMKKKPIRIGMIFINIFTLRWAVYAWLPNVMVSDLFRIKYYLYIKEENQNIVVTTG